MTHGLRAWRWHWCWALQAFCLLIATAFGISPAHSGVPAPALADLTLEQLSSIVVMSVQRRDEPLATAAASIYVIDAEEIRRSGARSIPEVLRLAPNLFVARADANQYAISARGFANVLANRLLVLIDGRIVYSPLFSGVFWEAQEVMLEDVERIEVISGPGATLWGANAVNGVINIITRPARDTQGALLTAGAGNRERGGAVRYGGPLGARGHYRAYGRYLERDRTRLADGTPVPDASDRGQAGFRADWGDPNRSFTLQGDAYRIDIEQAVGGSRDLAGANLIARWTERLTEDSTLRVQGYYDRVERDQPGAIRETLDIVDLELQHALVPRRNHRMVWGAGYRLASDRIENLAPAVLGFIPASRRLSWAHVFAQNEWHVRPDLALTVGVKAEHNDYTGVEWLPSARLAWRIANDRLLWSGLSRTARAPSRIDREFFAPAVPPHAIAGGPDFQSEVANIYELGYRAQHGAALSYSVTAFHHDHKRLRSLEPRPGGAVLENRIAGRTSGVEAWGAWRITPQWRLHAGWVELRQRLRPEAGSLATVAASGHGNDPKRWVTLRSHFEIAPRVELDLIGRYVGELPNPRVPSYTALDARLGWHASRGLELSVHAQNLFDRSHPEWGVAPNRAENPRGVFFRVLWRP